MGSVAHVEEARRELAKDVHRLTRLGVRLMSISDGGVTVQNGAESSLVVEVKEKKNSDPILLELKGAVHNQRVESPSTDRRSYHGPCWWSVVHHCNPSPNQLRKLAKSRLTDRPTVRRSDHGPWSVSLDRDFPYQPLTQTTVDQHGPSFDPWSVGLTVDEVSS
ncbi:hypothetical protein MTR67_035382 [Solanum verrucosum]|uniref:Uncharacterized protein n=1 Tax=Solanum verrucosum TaxID=315347 RepID=A0AAF0U9V0_SOLVR|nr:hypothetical protein MTR67_035382 [Solanum verrucosum]